MGAIDSGFDEKRIFTYSLDTPKQIIAEQILNKLDTEDVLLAKASHGVNLKSIIEIISG
jgi:hypothetical protein